MAESFLTGLYAGISSVAMKFIIEVLREEDDMDAMNLGLFLSIALTALSLLLNLTTMNHLLSLYPSLKAVPISQSLILVGTILCGGLMLDEFSTYSFNSLCIFSVGAVICVIGLYLKV